MDQRIVDWMVQNEATIKKFCDVRSAELNDALKRYDREYHNDIKKEFREFVFNSVRDMVCFDLGCSAEDFYNTVEGTEEKWISLPLD